MPDSQITTTQNLLPVGGGVPFSCNAYSGWLKAFISAIGLDLNRTMHYTIYISKNEFTTPVQLGLISIF